MYSIAASARFAIGATLLSFAGAMSFSAVAASVDSPQSRSTSCNSHAMDVGEWESLTEALRSSGLVLVPDCGRAVGALKLNLVVTDATRASQVLRGPLADGEAVDLGGENDQTSDSWSPDLRFNRAWLEEALKSHHFIATALGEWRLPKADEAGIRVALR